ncbi:MAG: hypothetical protein WAU01_16610 [Saprospiraceae bacterium]
MNKPLVKICFYAAILVFLLLSCKQKPTLESPSPVTKDTVVTLVTKEITEPIPGIPEEVMVKLLNECTFIDYIFHTLPFSLSQNEDPSIDQNIQFIDYERPLGHIPKGCKAIARKFFMIQGKSAYDVDVYLSDQCKFYVFVDHKNKPIYANHMTAAGIKFYTQIINQVNGVKKQSQ